MSLVPTYFTKEEYKSRTDEGNPRSKQSYRLEKKEDKKALTTLEFPIGIYTVGFVHYQLPELQRPLLSCWSGGGRIRVALLESEQELRFVLALDHLGRKIHH